MNQNEEDRLHWALRYAAHGWPIFPMWWVEDAACACGNKMCHSPGKHPIPAHGFKEGTTDQTKIRAWWTRYPNANIGLSTGEIAVLDLDLYKPGTDESVALLIGAVGGIPPTVKSKTGGGGNHHFYRRRPDGPRFKSPTKFAGLTGVDVRADNACVALPPSVHLSRTPYEWMDDWTGELAWAPDWLGSPAQVASLIRDAGIDPQAVTPKTSMEQAPKNGPDWVEGALSGMGEGNRNGTLTKIAGKLHHANFSPGDMMALLTPHAVNSGLKLSELYQIVKSVSRYPKANSSFVTDTLGLETENESPILRVQSVAELMGEAFPPTSWRLEGLLPTVGAGIIAGRENVGKSWLTLDIALDVAAGRPWLGKFPTEKGCVLVLDLEGDPAFVQKRLRGLLAHKGLTMEDLNLYFVFEPELRLAHPFNPPRFLEVVERIKPDLIIADSLVRLYGANENSSQEMSQFLGLLKRVMKKHKVAFLMVDHLRKAGETPMEANQMIRGSTDKAAWADLILSISKDKDSDEIVFRHTKARYSEKAKPFKARLERLPGGTALVHAGDYVEPQDTDAEDKVLEIIQASAGPVGTITRKEVLTKAKPLGLSQKSTDDALAALVEASQIVLVAQAGGRRGGRQHCYRVATQAEFEAKFGKTLEGELPLVDEAKAQDGGEDGQAAQD